MEYLVSVLKRSLIWKKCSRICKDEECVGIKLEDGINFLKNLLENVFKKLLFRIHCRITTKIHIKTERVNQDNSQKFPLETNLVGGEGQAGECSW